MKKTTKIIINLILCVTLAFGGLVCVSAETDVKVTVDGSYISFDVPPQLIGGRTMAPLRAIFEALGASVMWDADTSTVAAYNEAYIVKASIGNEIMTVNGAERRMDIPPMLIDNRTLIPARFVAEAFNCGVDWDAGSMTVRITTKPIDYTQIEQGTPTEAEQISSEENGLYYNGVRVPNYGYITGSELYDIEESGDCMIYHYSLNADEYEEYMDYLSSDGWSVYSSKSDNDNLGISTNMIRGSMMISLSSSFKYGRLGVFIFKKYYSR